MNLLNQKYKYIFVGGKGGVGKTTTSCSIALQLAQKDRSKKILLISTDPAHNVSDALAQQFSSEIQQVNNVPNLYAIEIDPSQKLKAQMENNQENDENIANMMNILPQMIQNMSSIPGIDEMINFLEVIKLANEGAYETIVFDTAPTGHTLRFLEIPKMAQKVLGQFQQMKNMFQPLITMLGPMFQMNGDQMNQVFGKLEEILQDCKNIEEQFTNPLVTTFVSVCIPEFLSLYETERLVQHLARIDIDCSTVVINQILNVGKDCPCNLCKSRRKMQQKYIGQIDTLYENFDVIKMPLQEKEVRGVNDLLQFGNMLINGIEWTQ